MEPFTFSSPEQKRRQQEQEERFNRAWDKLSEAIYVGSYYTFRHIRRRWMIVLASVAFLALCWLLLRFHAIPWKWDAGLAFAVLFANIITCGIDERDQVHVDAVSFRRALQHCGLLDSTHFRTPKMLKNVILPGGDVDIIVDSTVPEDVWQQPHMESRFCGTFGISKLRRVYRDNRNQVHLVLASGHMVRPKVDAESLLQRVRQTGIVPLGVGFDGEVVWNPVTQAHLLLCGMTGSGKSTLIRWILRCLGENGTRISLVDPKLGVDYGPVRKYLDAHIATDAESALPILQEAWKEHTARLQLLLGKGFTSLHEAHEHGELLHTKRHLIVIDEYAIFASSSRDKASKEISQQWC